MISHFLQDLFENLAKGGLIADPLGQCRIMRYQVTSKIELAHFHLLAQFLPFRFVLRQIGLNSLKSGDPPGQICGVHAAADIRQHQQLHRIFIRVRFLDCRSEHGKRQKQNGQQPKPQ